MAPSLNNSVLKAQKAFITSGAFSSSFLSLVRFLISNMAVTPFRFCVRRFRPAGVRKARLVMRFSGFAVRTPASAAKNSSAKGGARQSAIHHQLDRVDVRRIVRGKKENSLREFFRFTPAA